MKDRQPLRALHARGCMVLLEKPGAVQRPTPWCRAARTLMGLPAAMLLLHRDCTITICHSRTKDLAAVCRERIFSLPRWAVRKW